VGIAGTIDANEPGRRMRRPHNRLARGPRQVLLGEKVVTYSKIIAAHGQTTKSVLGT